MKRILIIAAFVCSICVQAQQPERFSKWYSSATDREYVVAAETVKGDNFECLIYAQSLYMHIPVVGLKIYAKDIPAFVAKLRSLAEVAGTWWQQEAASLGVEDLGRVFAVDFPSVTAWYDPATPPDTDYHDMNNAKIEAYSQMQFAFHGVVFLSVSPIVDKDTHRHPGLILPFGNKEEIEAFAKALEYVATGK